MASVTAPALASILHRIVEANSMSAAVPGSVMAQQMSAMVAQSQSHNAFLQHLAANSAAPSSRRSELETLTRELLREDALRHFPAADGALPDSDE